MTYYRLAKVSPTGDKTYITGKSCNKEYLLVLLDLLDKRDEIETRISFVTGDIDEATKSNLLENTFYKIEKI